jgi:uracil-DNA glycosylase family 4
LAQVAAEVAACRTCPRLVDWREQVAADKVARYRQWDYWGCGVPGFGDPDAHLVIIGLAPAAHGANRTGRVFTGDRSGDFLYAALHRNGYANQPTSTHADDGLRLSGAYVTAAVKCAPPANKPTPVEREACRPFLRRELAMLASARVLLALGRFGWDVVCSTFGARPRPVFTHGAEVALPGDLTLLASYHVSQQNTFTGTLTEAMLDDVLRRARAVGAAP